MKLFLRALSSSFHTANYHIRYKPLTIVTNYSDIILPKLCYFDKKIYYCTQ